MHDPLVIAFEIPRPWPEISRPRNLDGTPAPAHRYWPPLVTVWHREPGGHDSGEVCKQYTRYQDETGVWQWRFHRAWRFHVHHWKVQVHPLQEARRRLLTRCTWCGGRSTRRDPVNHGLGWDSPHAPWWQGERRLFHGDCLSVRTAHRTCLCDDPAFEHEGWGSCARCGKRRSYGCSEEALTRMRELVKIPAGQRQGVRPWGW